MTCEPCKIGLLFVLMMALIIGATWQFVGPPPPDSLRIATGRVGGAYHNLARQYRDRLLTQGMMLDVQTSAGSVEALQLLANKQVDMALVQGGTASTVDATQQAQMRSLGSIAYEPIWVFYRQDLSVTYLSDLRGHKVAVGEPGSGTRSLALQLLSDNALTAANTTLLELSTSQAVAALLAQEVDAAFFVSALNSETIQTLLHHGTLNLLDMRRAPAYVRRHQFLTSLAVSEGLLDLGQNIPTTPKTLLATTTSLVVRADMDPLLIRLLLRELKAIPNTNVLLNGDMQFPSTRFTEFTLGEGVANYLESGPSWLENLLPFRVVSLLDRLKIMIFPLLTLIPLVKIFPPLYRWRIRSRIYRRYADLRAIDLRLETIRDAEALAVESQHLSAMEQEFNNAVSVPLSYAGELYNLGMHMGLVRQRLERCQQRLATMPAVTAEAPSSLA